MNSPSQHIVRVGANLKAPTGHTASLTGEALRMDSERVQANLQRRRDQDGTLNSTAVCSLPGCHASSYPSSAYCSPEHRAQNQTRTAT